MKYVPKYPSKGFNNLTEAREWVRVLVTWYNNKHLHSGIEFITPYQRHYGLDRAIMQSCIHVYQQEEKSTLKGGLKTLEIGHFLNKFH